MNSATPAAYGRLCPRPISDHLARQRSRDAVAGPPWRADGGRPGGTIRGVPEQQTQDLIGPNSWLVDEMYEQYLADPSSVSEAWQDFFADYSATSTPHRSDRVEALGAGRSTRRPQPTPPRTRECGRLEQGERDGRAAVSRSAASAPASSRTWRSQPRRSHRDELPADPGQAARGQPPGDQRLPRPDPGRQGQLHPPHRLRRGPGHRRRRCR